MAGKTRIDAVSQVQQLFKRGCYMGAPHSLIKERGDRASWRK